MPSSINFSSLISNPATYKVLLLALFIVIGGILFVELAPDASAHAGHTCLNESCSSTGSCQIHLAAPTTGCPSSCCSIGPALCIADEVKAKLYDCSTVGGSCTATGATVDDSCTSWEAEGKDPNDCAECAGPNPAPTCSISPSSSTISAGGSQTLTLSSTNATSCTTTLPSCSGSSCSTTVSPASTTTYIANCSGTGGSGNCNATVTVTPLGCTTDSNCTGPNEICAISVSGNTCFVCNPGTALTAESCTTLDDCTNSGDLCGYQNVCRDCSGGGGGGGGGVISFGNPLGTDILQELLDRVLDILIIFGGALYVLMILIAAFIYTTSGANPQKRTTAKNILIFSTIGFFILITGRVILFAIKSFLF